MADTKNNIEEQRTFTNAQMIRGVIVVFMFGMGVARFEYKMNQVSYQNQVIIEKYKAQNDFDKKEMSDDITELKISTRENSDQIKVNTLTIQTIANFIKPEEIEFKRQRR